MPAARPYHHGNLREALIAAAIQLIETQGPLGFTMAEAARMAGVSAAAPYRHFKGRDDLLAEVARIGFVEFGDRLGAAFDEGKPRPMTAFMRVGHAYLDFAAQRQGLYMAMFESGVSISGSDPVGLAARRADKVLMDMARSLIAHFPEETRPPARMVADHIFAMSHGVVELFARGRTGGRSPIAPADMLESAVLIYLRGLSVSA
ncbi:TetR/AcrR family transcriptional regulator [Paracoccus suum]|uniref:TetR/AcrR family transcriptional regulator n=1 Tax=Paracoccus suum TaxID=2259340 RepID=A0A344PIW8_9RHOB|nr:TetR/AcrR family transcriptional regulator [Paracoccus suum]AXC49323.1 TetR/AcrR family transcriptional regulator [Paracoccus suum]